MIRACPTRAVRSTASQPTLAEISTSTRAQDQADEAGRRGHGGV